MGGIHPLTVAPTGQTAPVHGAGPANTAPPPVQVKPDPVSGISSIATQVALENALAGAAGADTRPGFASLLGTIDRGGLVPPPPDPKAVKAYQEKRDRLARERGITVEGLIHPNEGERYLSKVEEMAGRGDLPKGFRRIEISTEKEMYDPDTGTLHINPAWIKNRFGTLQFGDPPRPDFAGTGAPLASQMADRTRDLLKPSVLEKQARLKAQGLTVEDPQHVLSAPEKEQLLDKLLDLKSRGVIPKETSRIEFRPEWEDFPDSAFSLFPEAHKKALEKQREIPPGTVGVALQTDTQGNARIDRMAAGLEKQLETPKELVEARRRLKGETGVTLLDREGRLTVGEEQQVITHIRETFAKNGITFPPDTVVRIEGPIGRSTQNGNTNEIEVRVAKDEKGDVILTAPRKNAPGKKPGENGEAHSHDSDGMLRVLTHELAHQDDDASKSPRGLERARGGNETAIADAEQKKFKTRLEATAGFNAWLVERITSRNTREEARHLKDGVTEALKDAPPALKDHAAILAKRFERGEITHQQYLSEVTNTVGRFTQYGRMRDSKGRDLYNRAAALIEAGKDSEKNDPLIHQFRERFDPVVGRYPEHQHSEGSVTNSRTYSSTNGKYGETDSEEFYAHSMEHYVHEGAEFRSQIARHQNQALLLATVRDRHPRGSAQWKALDERTRYVAESADILKESYQFMKRRFHGKEF